MSRTRSTHDVGAFTLVELLVVITIIGILIALLLPAVQAAREAARRMQCSNNLKQMGLAVHNWHDAHGRIPPSYLTGVGTSTWLGLILPYMENQSLYDAADVEEKTVYALWGASPTSPTRALVKVQIGAYYCPSRRGPQLSRNEPSRGGVGPISGAVTDYAMNVGDGAVRPWWGSANPVQVCNGISPPTYLIRNGSLAYSGTLVGSDPYWLYKGWKSMRSFAEVRDGLSNTLMIGDKHVTPDHLADYNFGDGTYFNDDSVANACRMAGQSFPLATAPTDMELGNPLSNEGRFGSWHAGGLCQFAMADGSVQVLSPAIDSKVLGYLANYSDGHVIPANAF